MSPPYDAVVIGAGHNGLTCACYLADAGLKVMVLEQSHAVGGMTTTEEITFPGFKSDLHAFGYQFANLSPVPQELELSSHGFELIRPEINYSHVFPDGGIVSMHRHIDDTVKSIERYSKQDGRAWHELMEKFLRAKDGIAAWMNSPPASLASSIDRLACMPHGLDEYRFELQSLRSWCNETFEAEQTKLFLGAFACHASVAPDDVGGAHLAWLFTSIIQDMGNRAVKGGMHHLPLALASHLQSRGGEIRTDARVSRNRVKGGKAVGVQLADGEEITVSKVVASNADPRHLIVDLLGEQHVGADIVRKIERYEWGNGYMVIYLALDGAAQVPCGRGRRPVRVRASDTAHPGISCPNLCGMPQRKTARRPARRHVQRLGDGFEPLSRRQGRDEADRPQRSLRHKGRRHRQDRRTRVGRGQGAVCRSHPRIGHKRIRPESEGADSETRGAFAGGHGTLDAQRGARHRRPWRVSPLPGGSAAPIPELGQYRTPVANVYLCGSGSHPGGGVSMAPGRNAAHVIPAEFEGR